MTTDKASKFPHQKVVNIRMCPLNVDLGFESGNNQDLTITMIWLKMALLGSEDEQLRDIEEIVVDELKCNARTLDNAFHGYVSDKNYNPVDMEYDGKLTEGVNQSHSNLTSNMQDIKYHTTMKPGLLFGHIFQEIMIFCWVIVTPLEVLHMI